MQSGGRDILTQDPEKLVPGEKGSGNDKRRGEAMKISKKITKISLHVMAVVLTVTLVTGLAAIGNEASAVSSSPSPFRNTKSSYQHNGRFDGQLIVHGVDASYFQSTASDWNAAKKNKCDFAILRVTYTTYGSGSLNIDSKFATHFKKAKAAGVMRGVYVFSQAKNASEARKEAQYAVKRLKALGIGPKDVELPVYMDYEFAGSSSGSNRGRLYGLTRTKAIESVNAFADVIRANGYDPGVYANTSFFNKYLANGKGIASDVDLWCAQYYSRCESPCNYTKWQYTSTAKVNGIKFYSTDREGSADADFWYLKRKANPKPQAVLYGNTNLNYTGKPVRPVFEIYANNKCLKEGVDYVVGGINNINKSSSGAYAYIKGIGAYGGYALVPITIDSGFIKHIGLSGVGKNVVSNVTGGTYKIGTNSYGSYIRNIPANTTAGTLISKLKVNSSTYTIAVIDAKGKKVAASTKLGAGMMLGVYNGSTLKGTADITVIGKALNNVSGDYLVKVSRSKSATGTTASKITNTSTATAPVSDGKLTVDGSGGPATVKALQKFLKASQTGKVTVTKSNHQYNEGLKSIVYGTSDQNTVTRLQKWLGITADGDWGPGTSRALQKRLNIAIDGYFGTNSMKSLQRYLNMKL